MRILISGSSGFVGRALSQFLEQEGHDCVPLVRHLSEKGVFWDPETGDFSKEPFEDFDAVIHLAGENIASRWTKSKKKRIFLSRAQGTWLLSQVLTRLYRPPQVMITASAIGFYGDRGDEILTEDSPRGSGFLADVCCRWENATEAIENRGTRVVHTRFGAIMDPQGGVLKKLLPLFRCGLGGRWGTGEQYMSWVALADVCGAINHVLNSELTGPVNVTSPHPIKQKDFAQLLATKLHRSTMPTPAWLLRLVFGQMAEETMLASARVEPEKLLNSGYHFKYANFEKFLAEELEEKRFHH